MTTSTDPDTDRSQDRAATQNTSQCWLDELANVDFSPIDQARARAKALDRELEEARLARERQQEPSRERDLDHGTQLLDLEHELGRLISRIDELTDDLRSTHDTLHNELRNARDLAGQVARGVATLEAKSSLRPEIRFFGVAVLLLALAIAATGNFLLGTLGERPRAQGLRPPLADAPPPRYPPPLELTPAPSRLSPLPP